MKLEKDIVKNMMDQLKLLDVKYGVLEYDQNARVILELGTDSTQVENALEGMSWRSDATGLANVRLLFFRFFLLSLFVVYSVEGQVLQFDVLYCCNQLRKPVSIKLVRL